MRIPYYQLNSFTGEGFQGNPAGVCILETWLSDEQMQTIAAENNLSETAFIVPSGTDYEIRWFTPAVEVDLCGHATLATAAVLFERIVAKSSSINFHSRSGLLSVRREGNSFIMNFPSDTLITTSPDVASGVLECKVSEAFNGKTDMLVIISSEEEVRSLRPDMNALMKLGDRGVIVSAKGDRVDFVSRFFAPQSGIPEDPVTGSAHTTLTPYWAEKLGKTRLKAWQLSARGGEVDCHLLGDRVELGGKVTLYLEGYLQL